MKIIKIFLMLLTVFFANQSLALSIAIASKYMDGGDVVFISVGSSANTTFSIPMATSGATAEVIKTIIEKRTLSRIENHRSAMIRFLEENYDDLESHPELQDLVSEARTWKRLHPRVLSNFLELPGEAMTSDPTDENEEVHLLYSETPVFYEGLKDKEVIEILANGTFRLE